MTLTLLQRQTISGQTRPQPKVIRDVRLERCTFEYCSYGRTVEPLDARHRIENVHLVRCTNRGKFIHLSCVVFDEVVVDGWQGAGLWLYEPLFRHVTVRGKCGQVIMRGPSSDEWVRAEGDRATAEFYADVDWALDISEAEFTGIEFRGVPAHLVRRDPETQMVARLERIRETEPVWKKQAYVDEGWPAEFHNMMQEGTPSAVIIAPKRSRSFKATLARLKKFRRLGILEAE